MTDSNNKNDDEKDPLKEAFAGISKGWGKFLSKSASSAISPKQDIKKLNLFSAVRRNNTETIIKILSQDGFNINAYNSAGYTALHVAAQNGSCEAALILLENGANPLIYKEDDPSRTPLEVAANYNKTKMVELLARRGGYVTGQMTDGWSLLHRSCEKGRADIVQALINAGADCNEKTNNGSTPILIASAQNKKEVLKALLKFPKVFEHINTGYVSTDIEKRTALHWAVENNEKEIIKIMAAMGANINVKDATGKTPLFYSIDKADIETIKLIISNGGDINYNSENYGSALLYTANSKAFSDIKKIEILSLLLKHGADPEIKSPGGLTPLHALALGSRTNSPMNYLLKYPVNKELTDAFGASALMYIATSKVKIAALGDIVRAGANPDLRHGHDASTALIQAAKSDNIEAIVSLLSLGANPKLYDYHNNSALSYARNNNNIKMIKVLENALKPLENKPSPPSI